MGTQNWREGSPRGGKVTRGLIQWSAVGGAVGLGATLPSAP